MVAFNIVCIIIFVVSWLALLVKASAFIALPSLKRTLIALAFAGFMVAWIGIDRLVLGV